MKDMLKQIQKIEYDMLKELDRICRQYKIRYFLAQGTLLGAVKYKGFIPWDDDIDVFVPYQDLEKLIKIFPEASGDKYIITNHKAEKFYPVPWTKIRAKNTLSRPKRYKDLPINWGICIDLFGIYPISDIAFLRKLEILSFKVGYKMLIASITKYEDRRGFLERILEKIPICIRHFFADCAEKMLKMHKNDTNYVLIPCKGVTVIERKKIFAENKYLLFEDREFPVPSEYYSYLSDVFGDFMKPYPIEKQRGHDLREGEIEWEI